ncbi:acyl-CoA dehydrogenase family member 11 [Exaiptasia diaphana]|uniref:Acyl-CoA dehydrogenase n=1 Tax=Exaiptasia diaphana TaxID=2652724 RepID=A0A913Y532_EXADI|nr:acyl-CoA dehydrogenase family member 11 [Exaiptasia diaphana]KXJ28911.1 putative acyl-CoA dehydrogenase AidB [Exaiptasia diaphana]
MIRSFHKPLHQAITKAPNFTTISRQFLLDIKYVAVRCSSSVVLEKHAFDGNTRGAENVKNSTQEFGRSRRGTFFQDPPELDNQFTTDVHLKACLKRILPKQVLDEITPDLVQFGHRVATDINDLGRECEKNPPTLDHFDAWGQRIDHINTCNAWNQLHDISAKEGLIATAYNRKYQEWSRIYQTIKLYLFSPSSGLYSCPLAMTDGAAKTIEVCKLTDTIFQKAYDSLISTDPWVFWTSGQWMTERQGGSDVANGTETQAIPQTDGTYRLYGYKWFSSATDADMCLTLARIQQPDGSFINGSKGLTMFYLEMRDENGKLNNIEVQRLKNKLGTRQLPTAELLLDGAVAHQISEEGRGVAGISNMLTISRIHNSISAVSAMRRIVSLAKDYSLRRSVFGKRLIDHPLHMQTLARLEVEVRGSFLLLMELSRLLGLDDCKMANEEQLNLLRLLTPISKLYTAKQAMSVTSEGLECFGGQGYIEDTGLPGIMRDAQVLPIWEGTTNVLSLDVLRAIHNTNGQVLRAFHSSVLSKMARAANSPALKSSCDLLDQAVSNLMLPENFDTLSQPLASRDFAYSLARIYIGALLIEHASWEEATIVDAETAKRWCFQDLTPVLTNRNQGLYRNHNLDTDLVMNGHPLYTPKL